MPLGDATVFSLEHSYLRKADCLVCGNRDPLPLFFFLNKN